MSLTRAAVRCSALLIVLPAAVASGQTIWYVNAANCPGPGSGSPANPFCKIQSAINAAAAHALPPDEIVVADGIYAGTGNKNLDFGGKTIKLRSANGPANCIIDCQTGGRGFYFHSGETAQAVVDGLTIRNGNVTGDTTVGPYGGGVYISSSSPTLRNCVIQTNTVPGGLVGMGPPPGAGAGLYCHASNSTLINCTIWGNVGNPPVSIGGGLCVDQNCNLTLTNCTIRDNTIASGGSGIDCYNSHLTLTGCVLRGNNVTTCDFSGGGGLAIFSTQASLTNCIITGNNVIGASGTYPAHGGGGIYCSSSSMTVTNCTIARNLLTPNGFPLYGGGVYIEGSSPILTNCILWRDTPREIYLYGGTPVVSYSDVQGGWTGAGTGNINLDPRFVNPGTYDYHLTADSPCIDVGSNTAVPAGLAIDIDGDPRILPGHPLHVTLPLPGQPLPPAPPPVVDMGADEFKPAPLPEPDEAPIG